MKLEKRFKGQVHFFDLPDHIGEKLLKDPRYKKVEETTEDLGEDRPRRGRPRADK